MVHLWLDVKRVVDFLLVLIEFSLASSHGCGTIKRNLSKSAFSEGVGHFERKFLVDGEVARDPFYGPLDRGMMSLQLCRWKFSHKET